MGNNLYRVQTGKVQKIGQIVQNINLAQSIDLQTHEINSPKATHYPKEKKLFSLSNPWNSWSNWQLCFGPSKHARIAELSLVSLIWLLFVISFNF